MKQYAARNISILHAWSWRAEVNRLTQTRNHGGRCIRNYLSVARLLWFISIVLLQKHIATAIVSIWNGRAVIWSHMEGLCMGSSAWERRMQRRRGIVKGRKKKRSWMECTREQVKKNYGAILRRQVGGCRQHTSAFQFVVVVGGPSKYFWPDRPAFLFET